MGLNSGCVSVIWWMLRTQESLGRSWLLLFATVATESVNRQRDCWLTLLEFGFCCFYSLLISKGNTVLSPLMVHCICVFCLWFLLLCPIICLTSLCGPHIMRVYFPRVKPPLVPRVSWKGGCFLWFLSVGSWVHRLLEKEGPWGWLKIVPNLQLKGKGSWVSFPKVTAS